MALSDPLSVYNAKRDFKQTAEPAGKRKSSKGGNLFIVQKHDATRLHWDFRIEVDGVLKSWAVTRGPSLDPADKRLSVQTEDHPMAYAEFEGTIPQGEYGGGTVMLWDRGTWEPVEGKSAKDLEKGHLHFSLHGERMKGDWMLIRLKKRGNEKRENWLLRKIDDEFAGAGVGLVDRALTSVLTGRTMAEIAADKQGAHSLKGKKGNAFAAEMEAAATHNAKKGRPAAKAAKKRKEAPFPKFEPVQLATLVDEVPTGSQWMHEIKFDGYRALVAAKGSDVRVYTRSGLDWTEKFAPLVRHFAALDLPSCLIDGEIVAADADGNPDFSRLQSVLKRGHGEQGETDALSFHAFDVLELEGEDLKPLTNIERKQRLAALLAEAQAPIHAADHAIGGGEKLLAALCGAGQEGIICKRADAAYSGKRTRNWLKVKCILRQEFVIVGYSKSSTKQRPFASLLLAQRDGEGLVYKGKVGTGFNDQLLDDLAKQFAKIETADRPIEVPKLEARGATWLKPELVAEISFAEFTAENRVRHASFVGLREDKKASDVVAENAVHIEQPELIAISNRDRVIFPETGQTKGNLADYYAALAPAMLAFAANRPTSLVRCPQGRAKQCFFQKHDSGSFGEHVGQVPIREKDGHSENYLFVKDAEGILTCVQMGTIEFHGWCSRVEDVEKPERMVIDLDPDEDLDFEDVKRAAKDIRDKLSDLGLVSFAMLSGGKGIHVVVPLRPDHSWAEHADFAERFARALGIADPDRYVATMSKAKRKGRIFIDWLRNQRGSTAVMPYSARARAGAPVAVPITWDELADFKDAHPFSIGDIDKLLERAGSRALAGWGTAAQSLPKV